LMKGAPNLGVEHTPSVAVDLPDLLRTAAVEQALQSPANGFGIVPVLLKVEKIIDWHVELLSDRNNRFKRRRSPSGLQIAEKLCAHVDFFGKLRLAELPRLPQRLQALSKQFCLIHLAPRRTLTGQNSSGNQHRVMNIIIKTVYKLCPSECYDSPPNETSLRSEQEAICRLRSNPLDREALELLLDRHHWIVEEELSYCFGKPPWFDSAVAAALVAIVSERIKYNPAKHCVAHWIRMEARRAGRILERTIAARHAKKGFIRFTNGDQNLEALLRSLLGQHSSPYWNDLGHANRSHCRAFQTER
jgi:hypothetical protein